MIGETLLQMNFTVTTTILQQTNDLPLTDWITATSTLVMTIATIVLAIYAYLTVEEGKKDRRKDTIERELEQLYNPLFEFLDIIRSSGVSALEHHQRMLQALENYGHYLDSDEHAMIRKLLTEATVESLRYGSTSRPLDDKDTVVRFGSDSLNDSLTRIKRKRADLKKELEDLTKV